MDADLVSNIDSEVLASRIGVGRKDAFVRRFDALLRFVCSVRLGVALLLLLGAACLIGMLVMQQTVDGFENYYGALTPAQRTIYGQLGLFNIYHAWYFNALLGLLSLNIILTSIDRFPKTWRSISRPQATPPLRWLLGQSCAGQIEFDQPVDDLASAIGDRMSAYGWKHPRVVMKNGVTYIFAESGAWNRLGAYPVHVALLTIFLGGFLTAQLGTTGQLTLAPGGSSDIISQSAVDLDRVTEVTLKLPFIVGFNDIEQKLVTNHGPITADNTLDWITRFTITDEGRTYDGAVQMNRPFDYRGYRFFQSSFVPVGRARSIDLEVTNAGTGETQELKLARSSSAALADGTRIRFEEFRGNFRFGPEDPNEDTSAYLNPGAILQIVSPNGNTGTAYAFRPEMADRPVAKKTVNGYTFRLIDFERVADSHTLSVQRDPGSGVVYVGFAGLFASLAAVFLFSHQRVWAALTDGPTGRCRAIFAGNTNRNPLRFEEKFGRFLDSAHSIARGNGKHEPRNT